MERIDALAVFDGEKQRLVSLYRGDLSQIPTAHAVDLVVVSAFPNDYSVAPNTLVHALARQGLSIAELAKDKEQDLRRISGFWISKPLGEHLEHLHIGRVACFEPKELGEPPQVVGELFRGLYPFLDERRDSAVAMPLLGAGNQGWPPEAILGPLVEAAFQWLRRGMPIAELKIVEIREDRIDSLAEQFDALKTRISVGYEGGTSEIAGDEFDAPGTPPAPGAPAAPSSRGTPDFPADAGYDVFLSYAEEDKNASESVSGTLKAEIADVRVFDYRLSINVGKSWQQEIDDAIEGCRHIVALLSPDYFASPECKEELMIARLRNKRSEFEVFFPMYWKDAGKELAMWLQAITYSDCREADSKKVSRAVQRLAARLLQADIR
jgi:hypothetical protein